MKWYWRYGTAAFVVAFAVHSYLGSRPPSVIGNAFEPERSSDYIAHSVTVELRKRFPVGMPEKELIARLDAAGFKPSSGSGGCGPMTERIMQRKDRNYIICPFISPPRTRYYQWGFPLCPDKKLGVGWAVNSQRRLVQIDGYIWRGCNAL